MIAINRLSKIYPTSDGHDVRALDEVSLKIERGEFVAIMGPSGSGKSTLMQILGLLDRPTSGEYFLDGFDVAKFSDDELAQLRCEKMGFIFQFFNLLPRTTALDNIQLPMIYRGSQETLSRAQDLLHQVGLGDRMKHRPHQLSGGQQQRVAIARALANSPAILFADEPTGNISSEAAAEVMALLKKLNRENGVTVVLVTHELDVATQARRLIRVRDGKIASDEILTKSSQESVMPNGPQPTHSKVSPTKTGLSWSKVKENIKMALVALSLNKMRTALATLGVVIGISSVVAMIAIGAGAHQAIEERLQDLGTNVLYIRALSPKKAGSQARSFRRFTLEDYNELHQLTRNNPTLLSVDANVYGDAVVAYKAENKTTEVVGAQTAFMQMGNYTPVLGRFFTDAEVKTKSRVALLGQTVVNKLYGESENPVGKLIKINRVDFTVIGVLPAKGASTFYDSDDQILMPLTTAMARVIGRRFVSGMTVKVSKAELIPNAISDIESLLRQRRKLAAHEPNDFEIRNLNEIQKTVSQTTTIISSMLALIACVSLIVGGIGIMNVMLVAVKERTKEVGLRKALGARKKDILTQFLMEAGFIGLLGGILGIFGGSALAVAAAYAFDWPTIIPVTGVFISFGFAFIVGLAFGLWPAKQASDLSPIEALRYE